MGMTTDGTYLIMSDGTSRITYLNPEDFKAVRILNVVGENGPVKSLNELEYIKGYLYANVYTTNTLLKIDPSSGKVLGQLDLSSLAQDAQAKYSGSLEMNGIAYDSTLNKLYVTGKTWPAIYEIHFNW
jgi:glutamine cyclotransferase